jgi:hypothetical protein
VANAVFAYENLAAADGASVTAANAMVLHPMELLTDGMVSQRCWLDAHTGTIYIDLGSGTPTWGLVALLGTNLDANMKVTIEATTDQAWGSVAYGPVDLPVSPKGNQGNRWLYLSSDRSERYLRIVIAEDSGGSVFPDNAKAGQLLVASPLRLTTNFSQSYAVQRMAGANVARTAYGVTRAYKFHDPIASWQIPFNMYPRQEQEALVSMWEALDGPCNAMLFVPDPDDSDRLALWCKAVESLQSQFDYWKYNDLGNLLLPLIEEPMSEELESLPGNHSALELLLDPSDGVLKDEIGGSNFTFTRSTQGTYIHPDTGARTIAAIDEDRFQKIRGKKALLMEGQTTQHLLNSQTPATQTTGSLATGTYILWCEGTGSAAVAGNTATITGAGTATQGVPVVFEVTAAGTVDVTVTGSLTFFQLEGMPVETSAIYSTTSATVRGLDVCSLALSSDVKKMLSLHEILSGLTPDATHTSGVGMDTTPDNAFILVDGQDLSAHAGGLVVVEDTSGYKAWAWVKAASGSRIYGSNLISNGDFESGTTGWGAANYAALSTPTGGVSGNCLQVTENGGGAPAAVQSKDVNDGGLYEYSAYDKESTVGQNSYFEVFDSSWYSLFKTYPPNNSAWTLRNHLVNADGTSRFHCYLGVNTSSGTGNSMLFDNAVLRQITASGSNGLLCFKSDGTTRGWAGRETGFDPNYIASAKFYAIGSGSHAGTALIAWAPGFDPTDAASDQNVIATDNSAAPLNVTTAGSLQLIDSTGNEARLDAFNWESGGYYRLLCQWNFTDSKIGDLPSGKMRVGFMSTTGAITWLGTPVDYCGALNLDGTLRLARSFAYLAHFGRLSLYSTVLSDDELRGEAFA